MIITLLMPFDCLLQIISSTTPCADFFFHSCLLQYKKAQHSSTDGPKKSTRDEPVRLIQNCSEVNLNLIVLWKVNIKSVNSRNVKKNVSDLVETKHCMNSNQLLNVL